MQATAYVRDGAGTRTYALGRSVATVSADIAARQVVMSFRLVGTPTDGAGPDLQLGTFAASVPIDPATGNFTANLTSSDRTVTGTITGHFFGPEAAEIGAAFGASVVETGNAPAFSVAGAIFGSR